MTDFNIMCEFDEWVEKKLCWICDKPRIGRPEWAECCSDECAAEFEASLKPVDPGRRI